MMSVPRLSIEQRRALVMLATAGRDGMTQSLLTALGFDASMRAAAARQQPSSSWPGSAAAAGGGGARGGED
jgi:hypothetical protein